MDPEQLPYGAASADVGRGQMNGHILKHLLAAEAEELVLVLAQEVQTCWALMQA